LKEFPGTVYCVNANLFLFTLIKIVSLSYPLIASIQDFNWQGHTQIFYNTDLYQYLGNITILQMVLTLQIVSKAWLQVLHFKYQNRTTMLKAFSKFQSLLIIFMTPMTFIFSTVSLIHGHSKIYGSLNWLFLTFYSFITDIIFTISCFILYQNIVQIIRVDQN
jgi:hypothetical protein